MTAAAIPWLCLTLMVGLGPLTDAQRQVLSTATDGDTTADAPGLFVLLSDAWTWPTGDETGAAVPDYAVIRKDLTAFRGRLLLIEGKLVRVRAIGRLARPGPWEDRLSEWTIQWGKTPDDVAVVDLAAPPEAPEVKTGAMVRLAARFYKVWRVQATEGPATDFLLFVGRDARVVAPGESYSLLQMALLLGIGLAAGVALVRLLRISARMAAKPAEPRTHIPEYAESEELDDRNLPDDPAEALREMQRRRDQSPPT